MELFYKDPKKYGYSFQSYAFFSRLRNEEEVLKKLEKEKREYDFMISERCVMSDNMIFARNSFEVGLMDEAEKRVYDNWFCYLHSILGCRYSAHIYLRCSPSISHQRILNRARPSESDISLSYLTNLHHLH